MWRLQRARTWEVSESEGEDGAARVDAGSTCGPDKDEVRAVDELHAVEVLEGHEENPASPATSNPAPSPRRRRRRRKQSQSEEERLKIEQRRAEKERRREEKEREKEKKRQEQQWRKEMAEKIKSLKPDNCLKCLTVHIHPVLLQESGCDLLLEVLEGLEWRSCIEEHDLPHSISWRRQIPNTEGEDGGVIEEDQVLMVVSLSEFMDMVTSIKQALIGDSEGTESLFQPLSEYLNRNTHTVVSLLVMGAQHAHRRYSWHDDEDGGGGGSDGENPRSQLGFQDIDIEEVLVYLQLYKKVSVHFLYGWKEAADHVCGVTKALSKRPFKALCEVSQLGFCVDGSWAGGVRVERGGRGLAQVWTRQLQQLNRVSVAMATALTAAYSSPQNLLQAYQEAESAEQQRKLLANITVRGGAGERRIGPELSNRVHRLMTSQNPELVLD